jgi:hypothetical protein
MYTKFPISESSAHLSLPTLRSSSSWASCNDRLLFNKLDKIHVRVIDVVSAPAMIRVYTTELKHRENQAFSDK